MESTDENGGEMSPKQDDKWAEIRSKAAAMAALPGLVHEFGKTVVIFAHPQKLAEPEMQARLMAFGDAERLQRMQKGIPYAVAFIPTRIRSGRAEAAEGERVEVLAPYKLPVAWHEIGRVKEVLRQRHLENARLGDVAFALGRHDVGELIPWVNRERLMRLLSGHCACCGAVTYPNLLGEPQHLQDLNNEPV